MKLTLTPESQTGPAPIPAISAEVPDFHAESMAQVMDNLVIPVLRGMGFAEHTIQTYINMGAIEAEIMEIQNFESEILRLRKQNDKCPP